MNFTGIDIDKLKLLNGCCLVQLHSYTEDEISFNGGTLKLVHKVKTYASEADPRDIVSAVKGMKKFRYKDKEAMKEYQSMAAELNKKVDENKESQQDKQAVRRGVIVKLPHACLGDSGWDYECEFDGNVGDEVWFDATYTREMITEGEGGFEIDGKIFLMIPVKSIYAVKKDDEILGLNGFVIGKRLPNDRKQGSLYLPDTKTARVEVVVPNARTPIYKENSPWTNTVVKKGDIVLMRDIFAIPLDATLAKSTDLVRFQTRVIRAYEHDQA
jgi:hypothetical protein